MLSIAALEADIVSVMPAGVGSGAMPDLRAPSMSRGVDRLRETAGDRFDQLELNTLLQRVIVTDNSRQVAEELGQNWQMTAEEVLNVPWVLIGTVDQIVDRLLKRRASFGISYWVVPDRFMDAFAPVVAQLAGQ
jgi:hypothetical protein